MDLMMFPLKQKVPPLLRLDNCIRYIYQINLHNRYLVKGLEVAGMVIFHTFQLFYSSNLYVILTVSDTLFMSVIT